MTNEQSSAALPSVALTRVVHATPERLFEAWLEREALAKFMCPAPGSHVAHVEVDPTPGGAFLIVMHVGGVDRPHRGRYIEIERYRRLVFSWASAAAGEDTRVVLTFSALDDGRTRLDLEHYGLPADARAAHIAGWTHILGQLEADVR